MAKARRRGSPQLLHPEQLQWRQLEVYYMVLSEEPGFEQDFEGLAALCTERLLPPEAIPRRVLRFCERWRLPPRTGLHDLLWSVFLVKPDLLDEGIDLFKEGIAVRNIVPSPRLVSNWPSVLELAQAISDPEPSANLSQIFERAETELRAELKRHGFKPTPPRHHHEQELRRLARRLCRRVIHEVSWQQIADAEGRDTGDTPDMRSVQATVREWAKTLGVPLLERPGGWPRGQSRD